MKVNLTPYFLSRIKSERDAASGEMGEDKDGGISERRKEKVATAGPNTAGKRVSRAASQRGKYENRFLSHRQRIRRAG